MQEGQLSGGVRRPSVSPGGGIEQQQWEEAALKRSLLSCKQEASDMAAALRADQSFCHSECDLGSSADLRQMQPRTAGVDAGEQDQTLTMSS